MRFERRNAPLDHPPDPSRGRRHQRRGVVADRRDVRVLPPAAGVRPAVRLAARAIAGQAGYWTAKTLSFPLAGKGDRAPKRAWWKGPDAAGRRRPPGGDGDASGPLHPPLFSRLAPASAGGP